LSARGFLQGRGYEFAELDEQRLSGLARVLQAQSGQSRADNLLKRYGRRDFSARSVDEGLHLGFVTFILARASACDLFSSLPDEFEMAKILEDRG
jgi:hypothetical protein